VSRSSQRSLTYNLSKVILHLYHMLAIHADTGISFIFAMSINCSIILLTVFNLMLCYIELELTYKDA